MFCKMKKKILFFTDLDNTVIYSHRHMISDPLVWVESLNGNKQSFISERTYKFFNEQNWLNVVPVTTRTYQQYARLRKMEKVFGWKDVLICNGAILLQDGVENIEWKKESISIADTDRPAYVEALKLAEKIAGRDSVVSVDHFMFYIRTDNVEGIFKALSRNVDLYHLSILRDSRKVYCLSASMNKGNAAERYMVNFGYDQFIAAGDSDFDIPLLKKADISFCPDSIGTFKAKGIKKECSGLFSDKICDELEQFKRGLTVD